MASLAPSGSLAVPLSPCVARRFLEQQIEEHALGRPQQERSRQSEQRFRVPCGQHALEPEPARSRTRRARVRASRDGHDEQGAGVRLDRFRRWRTPVVACSPVRLGRGRPGRYFETSSRGAEQRSDPGRGVLRLAVLDRRAALAM